MKRIMLLIGFLFLTVLSKAETSYTKSRLFIPIERFLSSDNITPLNQSVTGTAGYYAYPTATKQQCILLTAQVASVNLTITTEFYTPNDVWPNVVGNARLFAIVHLSATTGTAQLQATTIQSGEMNSLTVTTSYPGLATIGNGLTYIPLAAATNITRYELQTISTTATSAIKFQPNRLINVGVSILPTQSTANIEFYGLLFEYLHDPKKKR